MRILDLFCGAGGAGMGYHRAGFEVVGADLDPKPLRHNPHECYAANALEVLDILLSGEEWHGYRLQDFAAIHASPPCQAYSLATKEHRRKGATYPDLIAPVRERLIASGLPWVIENVPGAPLRAPILLCGSMFGLGVQRHRLFESPILAAFVLFAPATCRHDLIPVPVCGHGTTSWYRKRTGRDATIAERRAAMGIEWMNRDELGEAIPPDYTEWLGNQLMAAIQASKAA